jgi:hypothetical protein
MRDKASSAHTVLREVAKSVAGTAEELSGALAIFASLDSFVKPVLDK